MKLFSATLVFASLVTYSSAVGPLCVQGNKLLINGKSGVLKGNSLYWSNTGWGGEKYYNADVVNWLKRDWNCNVIRAAMGVEDTGGYLSDAASNKNRVTAVIEAAIKYDIYVIIDWHSHNAHQHQAEAIAFFEEMAKKYGKHNNVIYEIYNEPKNDVSWSEIKSYATAVIKAIRVFDQKNVIIVGTPSWSQDVDVAANDPITGYKNIVYAIHFYCGSHGQDLRNKITTALNKGIALFATEWGTVNADGNGAVAIDETYKWISFLNKNGISHCNWSINDKEESTSALQPGASSKGGWSTSVLTDSGKCVRNLLTSC